MKLNTSLSLSLSKSILKEEGEYQERPSLKQGGSF